MPHLESPAVAQREGPVPADVLRAGIGLHPCFPRLTVGNLQPGDIGELVVFARDFQGAVP